jgi:hypothetical protein
VARADVRGNSIVSSTVSPISAVQLQKLISSPAINPNAVSAFHAVSNSTTQGIDVTFALTDLTGISAVNLFRNEVLDAATATLIQSWNPSLASYDYSDNSLSLQAQVNAYYWLELLPLGTSGTPAVIGPQNILLNPQLAPPVPATSISASSSAATNGVVKITVNITGTAASEKVYVSGYKGNAFFVAIAQNASSPVQFNLDATGEIVTLKAIGVSSGGTEAGSGPTTTLTLSGVLTIPASPQGIVVNQIATGNQITFPASRDAGPIYKIYRAQRGQSFLAAVLLATVTGTAGTIQYLDTGGLSGDFEYFIVATNSAGDSLPSLPASPAVLFTSAGIPPNAPANTTNTATMDSVDSGSSALVRIYGPGGVGTSYNRLTGFGSLVRPNGTISGLSYSTAYAALWTGTTYVAVTTYPATLPDGWEFVGSIMTTAPTGVVGSGATFTMVIDGAGHVIQANPGALGAGYASATTAISGGGGSGAVVQPNVDPGGTISSYTVIAGGTLYATTPTGTVIPGAGGGTVGGGGTTGTSDGSRIGCVKEGTIVEVPEGTTEELLACKDWIRLDVGDGPLLMHPDTLVSVFKKACELTEEDRIEVKGATWRKGRVESETRWGIKVKRTCPGGVYHAGPNLVRLHNQKAVLQ